MNKILKKLRLTFVLIIAVLVGVALSHPVKAAGIGITFEEQFSNSHTAQVIASKFGKLSSDEITDNDIGITNLDISNKSLADINGIDIFNNLTNINISNNSLTNLPNSITNLSKLTYILAGSNQLTSLPENINNLNKLEGIYASNNKLTHLPDNITQLSNLAILYVDKNGLIDLPLNLEGLVNLQQFFVNDNQLTTLPDSLVKLKLLSRFYANNNKLDYLPKNIGELSSLSWLIVNNNQLTELPDSLNLLTELQLLSLSNNKFESFPAVVFDLPNLIDLDYLENDLKVLPDKISKLTKLQSLHLNYNNLSVLPDSLTAMKTLKVLELYNNQLTALPDDFGNLSNLQRLVLGKNQLTSLPSSFNIPFNFEVIHPNDFLADNLLPYYYNVKLNNFGMTMGGKPLDLHQQDDLLLIPNSSVLINNGDDLDNLDYSKLLKLRSNRKISESHKFILDNIHNDAKKPIDLSEFIENGIVKKAGSLYAQIRATGNGLFPNNSENAITSESVELKFQPTFYNLGFNLNGGQGNTPTTQQLVEGALTKSVNNPVRTGYIFTEWNTKIDGSGNAWNFTSSKMPANSVELYAQWKKNIDPIVKYTLRFNLNGGQGVVPANQILNKEQKAVKPTTPLRNGYTFKGWNTTIDGTGSVWNFESNVMPEKDVTLYAQWTKNELPNAGDSSKSVLIFSLLVLTGFALVINSKKRFLK